MGIFVSRQSCKLDALTFPADGKYRIGRIEQVNRCLSPITIGGAASGSVSLYLSEVFGLGKRID
jgi:hypothetical protein